MGVGFAMRVPRASFVRRTHPMQDLFDRSWFHLAALLVACGASLGSNVGAAEKVSSPDGKIQFDVISDGQRLHYKVANNGAAVIEPSPIVITIDGTDIVDGAQMGQSNTYHIRETYPSRGVHAQATNYCNGASVGLHHEKSKTDFTLEVRAFNDGVAFRYLVPANGLERVPDEATEFRIPALSTVWHHDLEGHYEAVHKRNGVADIEKDTWLAPPITFRLPGGAGYASITEAGLRNYSGMAVQADGNRVFRLALGHRQHVSYPFRLRYPNDIERLAKPAAIKGPIASPWRVIMIGRDLNALVNCDIVSHLAAPPDAALFRQGQNTAWIKPGRAVWRYLDGGRNTFDEMKEFSRLAGELGFEYHVIEGFWSRWSDEQIKEIVEYSRERGVGLWFWRHSRQLRTPEAQEVFFKRLHDLGVVGAKIDFFDHEHREVVDLYGQLLEAAARHKIMVNFHGSNKPTGEPRTWPNELVREGVRGMESSRLRDRAQHDATLPFTRFLAGHADYTPVHFGARRADTTWAHQVATAVVFTAPLLTYGAHPQTMLDNPCAAMIKSIPAVWDETIVLDGSEIGAVALFARRSGRTWFVAAVNGPTARTVRVPLAFLGDGEYRSSLVLDRPDDAAAVDLKDGAARRSETMELNLASGGGAIARFTPDASNN
jgi:alpha-glucosidase